MTVPSFLIIGAAKSGTTSLYEYLKQHPEIFMPGEKEPYFFARSRSDDEYRAYQTLFADRGEARAVGEASTNYLCTAGTPRLIHAYNPGMKLVAILREPAERALSHFHYNVSIGFERCRTFEDALAAEATQRRERWFLNYVELGLYARQLRRYYEVFPPDQILPLLYDDFRVDQLRSVRRVLAFLGVDDRRMIDVSSTHNVTRTPKHRKVDSALRRIADNPSLRRTLRALHIEQSLESLGRRIRTFNLTEPSKLNHQTKRRLIDLFAKDRAELEAMIGRDLSGWANDLDVSRAAPAVKSTEERPSM